jgi:tripeptide aminopeptidase
MNEMMGKILELAVEIQQIPAPTFAEGKRAAFIQQGFIREGLLDISIDDIGNVYGKYPGLGESSPVVITAHMDTVFPPQTVLKITFEEQKIFGPGIGDNSLGVAGLFGFLWLLRSREAIHDQHSHTTQFDLPGDIWLVTTVGEEGLGDLSGMRAIVDRFGDNPLAYIILEGMALGQIYHRGLGVRRYRITSRTAGGHSWVDYGRPSAIQSLAILINKLTELSLPEKPRTTLNVGIVQGGISVNTIAPQAYIELDLRSESPQILSWLSSQVELLVKESNQPKVEFYFEVISERPAGEIPRDHPLIQLSMSSLESVGIVPCLNIGSTDANIPLSQNIPAVCLGLTTGNGAHTVNEYINIQPLEAGMQQLISVVEGVFSLV